MRAASWRGVHRETRLENFIKARGVEIKKLLPEIPTHRSKFSRYRFEFAEARESPIRKIVKGFRKVLGEPIKANQLFDLGDDGELASANPVTNARL